MTIPMLLNTAGRSRDGGSGLLGRRKDQREIFISRTVSYLALTSGRWYVQRVCIFTDVLRCPTPFISSRVTKVADSIISSTEFDSYPEGAFAWIQVAAAAALFASSIGGIYTWGVLQEALVAEGVGNASTVSWIGSTQATVQAALAILIGRLVAHYGAVSPLPLDDGKSSSRKLPN